MFATVAALSLYAAPGECRASELHVGGATVSITLDRPVALAGQMHTRIARSVESPATATALALESRDGDEIDEQTELGWLEAEDPDDAEAEDEVDPDAEALAAAPAHLREVGKYFGVDAIESIQCGRVADSVAEMGVAEEADTDRI